MFNYSLVRYASFRLIDIPGLKQVIPITMEAFLDHVKASCKRGRQLLVDGWLAECATIVDEQREAIEEWMSLDEVSCTCLIITK